MAEWSSIVSTKKISDLGWWIIRLDLGVKIFFSISGFILAIPFINEFYFQGKKVDIKNYFYRRLTRLEPPFIISLFVFYIAQVLLLKQSWLDLLPHFLTGLFYVHVFSYGNTNPINPVTWSLETETQFYLTIPLFFIILFQLKGTGRKLLFFVSLMLVSIYLRSYTLSSGLNHLSNSILVYFINFGTGILFSFLYLTFKNYFTNDKKLVYDLLTILAIFGLFWFYKPQSNWLNNLLFNIHVLVLFIGVFKGLISNWFFTRPIIYLIGGMCYSIYLLHYALFYFLVKLSSNMKIGMGYWWDFGIQFIMLIPIMLLVCSLFYLLIEKPCMNKNWPQKLWFLIKYRLGYT
jgi:peptidoglycan/LPS O-acetylase OafA/YrhL